MTESVETRLITSLCGRLADVEDDHVAALTEAVTYRFLFLQTLSEYSRVIAERDALSAILRQRTETELAKHPERDHEGE